MNKDVLLTIYEIVHRDLTKQLNAEYCKRLRRCSVNSTISNGYDVALRSTVCNNVCKCNITIKYDKCFYMKAYNYRVLNYEWSNVYTMNGQYRCCLSANY